MIVTRLSCYEAAAPSTHGTRPRHPPRPWPVGPAYPARAPQDIEDTFMLARQLAPNTLFRGRGMGGKVARGAPRNVAVSRVAARHRTPRFAASGSGGGAGAERRGAGH
jgi:hypothetical protein